LPYTARSNIESSSVYSENMNLPIEFITYFVSRETSDIINFSELTTPNCRLHDKQQTVIKIL